jgi:AraC-like DNA-binding protein/ligand-binding sensor protein
MNEAQLTEVAQQLIRSRLYKDYELAFRKTTRLTLRLYPVGAESVTPAVGDELANPFCTIIAGTDKVCPVCPNMLRNFKSTNVLNTQTFRCFAGLTVTSVPVKLEDYAIAFLRTGQVLLRAPSAEGFQKLTARLMKRGLKVDLVRLENAYFSCRVFPAESYGAVVRLLEIFAAHLALIADKIVLQPVTGDSPLIKRAKDYVGSHYSDPIKLESISDALHISRYHFCRRFKQTTGLTFVEYLRQVRIQRAKALLRNSYLRVGEIAFEVGFQTLTHYNRTFRKIVGCSPTEYRSRHRSRDF